MTFESATVLAPTSVPAAVSSQTDCQSQSEE